MRDVIQINWRPDICNVNVLDVFGPQNELHYVQLTVAAVQT